MNDELIARYARLVVETGANIQRGQVVWIIAEPRAAPLARALAASPSSSTSSAYATSSRSPPATLASTRCTRCRLDARSG